MRTLILLLALCLTACDPIQVNVPPIVLPCPFPPEHCEMDDDEFARMFDSMADAEQAEYAERWGAPKTGFVSISTVAATYDVYDPPISVPPPVYWTP